jgi:hypothetical protein
MLLIGCLSLLSCAALARREKVKLAEDRQSRARELDAARVAAEPYRRFQAALRTAEALAPELPEREDHISEARLWLETAISEAEIASLARERLALEHETLGYDEAFLAAERERLALEDERERALAAEITREEMRRALARAAENPALRVKLSADETRRAAQSLLARAELIALAVSPDVAPEQRSALLAQIEKARELLPRTPDAALTLADQALLAGLALAGKTRAAGTAPTREQKASLVEALSLLGVTVTRAERGLSAAVADKAKESNLTRVCSVARDYPAGDVQVVFDAAHAGKGVSYAALLAKSGCEGQRFSAQPAASTGSTARGQNRGRVSFTFLAY